MCVGSLRGLCRQPLRELACAFNERLARCHEGTIAETRIHAGGAAAPHSPQSKALTLGEIIARVVVFEMLGPWWAQSDVYDVALIERSILGLCRRIPNVYRGESETQAAKLDQVFPSATLEKLVRDRDW